MHNEVTQVDRELYAFLFEMRGFVDQAAEIRAGEWDRDMGLKAIARHRIQSAPPARADVVEAVDDAVAALAAIRATASGDDWDGPETAKHFHDLCGVTIANLQAALTALHTNQAPTDAADARRAHLDATRSRMTKGLTETVATDAPEAGLAGEMRDLARRYEDTMGLTREGAIRRVEKLHDALLDFADRLPALNHADPASDDVRERVMKVRDGYASQAKFADHDCAVHFREFVRRIDASLGAKP